MRFHCIKCTGSRCPAGLFRRSPSDDGWALQEASRTNTPETVGE